MKYSLRKTLSLALLLTAISCFTACGENRNHTNNNSTNNKATDNAINNNTNTTGTNNNGINNALNETSALDNTTQTTDGVLGDIVDGVADGAADVADGIANGVDDIADGITNDTTMSENNVNTTTRNR